MAIFHVNLGQMVPGGSSSSFTFLKGNLWVLVEWGFYFLAKCHSRQPNIDDKGLEGTQRTHPNKWHGHILSSVATGLLVG